MVELMQIAAYALGGFFVIYVINSLSKSGRNALEKNLVEKLDRVSQLFTETNSLENALRKSLDEDSAVNNYFRPIIDKVNSRTPLETALFETSKETANNFFKKLCLLMISANAENGASIMYKAVKNLKERIDEKRNEDSKIMMSSFLMEFVFALVMPLLFYIMLNAVQAEITTAIVIFLGYAALLSALIEGVVFKKWADSLIKVPMMLSIFYIALFYIGPKLFSGFGVF